jgi:hypothetical protein
MILIQKRIMQIDEEEIMEDGKIIGHFRKLPMTGVNERVSAEPKVACTEMEKQMLLADIHEAAETGDYKPALPTEDNPSLARDYIFDSNDEANILKDLKAENFIAKVKDKSKGAKKRKAKGLPEEFLYVFAYPCELDCRSEEDGKTSKKELIIYIKINDRREPIKQVIVVSFHENHSRV